MKLYYPRQVLQVDDDRHEISYETVEEIVLKNFPNILFLRCQ